MTEHATTGGTHGARNWHDTPQVPYLGSGVNDV